MNLSSTESITRFCSPGLRVRHLNLTGAPQLQPDRDGEIAGLQSEAVGVKEEEGTQMAEKDLGWPRAPVTSHASVASHQRRQTAATASTGASPSLS